MSEAWKKFIFNWILPVSVFGVILIFLYASFTASIKRDSIATYEKSMVEATQKYASDLGASINKTETVGRTVSEIIVKDNALNKDKLVSYLEAITVGSDAYIAMAVDKNGLGYMNSGDAVDLSKAAYFTGSFVEGDYKFASNDGIIGNPALVIPVELEESVPGADGLLLFYPMNLNTVRRIVSVENDYDSAAYSVVVDYEGLVYASTDSEGLNPIGSTVWTNLEETNSSTTLRRVKNRIQSGSSGNLDIRTGSKNYLMTYTIIPGTQQCLIVNYEKTTVDKAESKLSQNSILKLGWIITVVVLFIVVVTLLNVIQIFISNKDTEELIDKADTDQLTGLKNKIATEREIKEYIENNPNAMGMLFIVDLDNFKKINDTMGHAFGDEVLRELGRSIGINFRVTDIIGRIGGDEFAIFLKNLKEDANTLREAQKLIYFFKHFQVGDYVKYTVTASIGAAVFPAHGTDFDSLYKSADAAVYKSKKRGKAQLSFFDDRDRTPEEVAYADSHTIDIERKEETPIDN